MKKAAVIPNLNKDPKRVFTGKIIHKLLSRRCEVFMDEALKEHFPEYDSVRFVKSSELFSQAELIITAGGDGTILQIAKEAAENGIPILGMNIGKIGYMAELEASEIDMIDLLFEKEPEIEQRMMLDVTIKRSENEKAHYIALNDAVIGRGEIAKIIGLCIACDNAAVFKYRADGVIFSTPTGSTAYNLSAGGPIIEPGIEVITVTPICAHALDSRTVIFDEKSVLTAQLIAGSGYGAYLSVDGRFNCPFDENDIITVKKSALTTKLVRLKERSFFDVLNYKLNNKI